MPPTVEPHDPRPRSRFRAALALPFVALYAFGYAAFGVLWSIVLPKHFDKHRDKIIRGWGWPPLWMFGVKLEFHHKDRRDAPGAKVLMFNHVSMLDLWIAAVCWPRNGVVLYKIEFHKIPVIGRALQAIKGIPVHRQNRSEGRASIEAAAAEVRQREAAVYVAPEGTRSRNKGGIIDFKMGPFHLAAATGAPVVPMIMRGIDTLWPDGKWCPHPGVVRIDFLESIPTADWDRSNVREHAAAVREAFLDYLPDAGTQSEAATAASQ